MKILYTKQFILSTGAVNDCLKELRSALKQEKVDSKIIIRLVFSAEEFFLKNIAVDNNGTATISVRKRFGKLVMNAECAGNELSTSNEDDFVKQWDIIEALNIAPSYLRNNGKNTMSFFSSVRKISSLTWILSALVLSLIIGISMRLLLSSEASGAVASFINPFCQKYTALLLAIALPQMFFLIIDSIAQIGNLREAKRECGNMIRNSFIANVLFTLMGIGACMLIFSPEVELKRATTDSNIGTLISQTLLNAVPNDFISPFVKGDMIQIVVMAITVGFIALMLGQKFMPLKPIIESLSQTVNCLLGFVCKFLPIYIFLYGMYFVLSQKNLADSLILVPFLFLYLGLLAVMGIMLLLYVKWKSGMGILQQLAAQKQSLLVALSTASGVAAYPSGIDDLTKRCNVAKEKANLLLPLGLVFCKPSHIVMRVFGIFIAAYASGITLTPASIPLIVLLSIVSTIATPVVPGGGIALFPILLTQFNLPLDSLPLVIIFYIITANIKTCVAALAPHSLIIALTSPLKVKRDRT